MNTTERLTGLRPIVSEPIKERHFLKRVALTTATFGLVLSCLGGGEDTKTAQANGPGNNDDPTPTPTATMIPDIQATLVADQRTQIADLRTQVADKTPVPPATPVPGATPVPPGSNVFVVPIPQAQPGPDRDVIVVKPEVVKPEVVKPEVVKVPEIVTVQVPVAATPNPDWVSLTRRELNALTEERAERIAEEAIQKANKVEMEAKAQLEAAKKAETEARADLEKAQEKAEDRDWTYNWWYALAGGAAGLIVGLGAATREFVVERIHPHHH